MRQSNFEIFNVPTKKTSNIQLDISKKKKLTEVGPYLVNIIIFKRQTLDLWLVEKSKF